MSTEPKQISQVLLVEDHHDAMEVLKRVADTVFDSPEIHATNTITAATQLISDNQYDVALLDLGLPDGSGLELIELISTMHPTTMSVVTTIFDDSENLFQALKAGAHGYLLKGYTPTDLQRYLTDLVNGRPALSPSIAHQVLEYFREPRQQEGQTDKSESEELLTTREMEILSLVAKGCQTKEVAHILDISRNTVAHHIKNIYSKLNVHNRAQATAAAMKMNIL